MIISTSVTTQNIIPLQRDVEQLVVALRYKSEGGEFDSRWCQWVFHWHNPVGRTIWPWDRISLQQKWMPGIFSGGGGDVASALSWQPYHLHVPIVMKSESLKILEPSGPLKGLIYLFNKRRIYIYDIFNCNWVATRWQLFSTHIHTNNTGKRHKTNNIHAAAQNKGWREHHTT
jgi:hypothetical protein